MLNRNISLWGDFVILRPINESDFAKIIEWRNNPEIARYLNQPYKLTMELQYKWYKEEYLSSDSVLFVIIEKKTGIRIGTIGFSILDRNNRIGILERLLVGEFKYRGSTELLETDLLLHDYLFYTLQIKKLYCYVLFENKKVISFDKKFGFVRTDQEVFPQRCHLNGERLIEMMNTLESYKKAASKLVPVLECLKRNSKQNKA